MDPSTVRDELDQICREGIAITTNEVDLGVIALAAPIYNHNENVVAG